jgi:hypothetical protein
MRKMPPCEAVTDIHAPRLYQGISLPMWVLYDHPADMPEHFVLRLWDGMTNIPTAYVFTSKTMEGITAQLEVVPGRFHHLERYEDDDPKILGVFL